MPSASESAEVTITCGNCHNVTSQKVLAQYAEPMKDWEWFDEFYETYLLSRCPACHRLNLSVGSDMDPAEPPKVLWPGADRKMSGLTPEIEAAYQAALRVKTIDSNAFGVLCRRLLEMVCIDRRARGHVLVDQLRDLSDKGEIPGRLTEMAQQLRQLGNIGAHASIGALTPAEVPFLEDLCRAILEYVYVGPQTIARVQARIDELGKKGSAPAHPAPPTQL